MRRAERLFRLVQVLRRAGKPITAAGIGEALEVSKRTVYRDIAHLQASGLPIDGEAGIGYLLRPGFDLPPMTFTTEQAEALALGARLVAAVADADLVAASREALAKLAAVLPDDTAAALKSPLFAYLHQAPEQPWLPLLREALRNHQSVAIVYESLKGERTERTIRPLGLSCFSRVWLVSAWCELREDFRDFRTDLIAQAQLTGEQFEDEPGQTLADYAARRRGLVEPPRGTIEAEATIKQHGPDIPS